MGERAAVMAAAFSTAKANGLPTDQDGTMIAEKIKNRFNKNALYGGGSGNTILTSRENTILNAPRGTILTALMQGEDSL